MIEEIIAGEDDSVKLASHARRRLKNKTPELTLALEGYVNDHHRFMLGLHWEHLSQLE
jgi:transposase